MNRAAWLVVAVTGLAAPPLFADEASDLRQQLEAQKAINAQLRQRIDALERAAAGLPPPALAAPAPRAPASEVESEATTTAIEEALVAKGLVLLPAGSFRIAPGFAWQHTGADALSTRSDTYTASVSAQAGLPFGLMASAYVPYLHRRTSIGSNSGAGDFSLGLARALVDETARTPALIASVNYLHDSGEDAFGDVALGSGFRYAAVGLSALKRADPLALFGSLAYTHGFSRRVVADALFDAATFSGRIEPGDAWNWRLGVSLAATPEITLDASLSGAFVDGAEVQPDGGEHFTLARSTVALVNMGAGFILGRKVSLLVSAAAGVTDDAPDFVFSASLPYRF